MYFPLPNTVSNHKRKTLGCLASTEFSILKLVRKPSNAHKDHKLLTVQKHSITTSLEKVHALTNIYVFHYFYGCLEMVNLNKLTLHLFRKLLNEKPTAHCTKFFKLNALTNKIVINKMLKLLRKQI